MINTFHIDTVMGKCLVTLPFLSPNELTKFNDIGYSGGNRSEYLNSLGKGQFQVTQTKFDNGNFEEAFTIVWVY